MTKLQFFILISIIGAVFGQCNVERAKPYLRRAVFEFNTALVSRLAEENDNHFVMSGLSPWALLSTISLGATEDTYEEIAKVLRLHPSDCFNKKFFSLIKDINSVGNGAVLDRSSCLFADKGMSLKQSFIDEVLKSHVSTVETIPFENPNIVAETINDYVYTNTRGNIDSIVSPNDLDGVYLVLIDALYFKGQWESQFSESDTEVSAFYDDDGSQIGDVNLMFAQQNVNINTVDILQATVLELPYSNKKNSMLIILPNQNVPLNIVIENLKNVNLRSILAHFTEPSQVNVQIPKFKIASDLDNLKDLLIDMGLKTMFDINYAKFSDMSDLSVYISNVIQKANIEVSEEGTEASAATEALFEGRSLVLPPSTFTANKPFLFMVIDREAEVPLFTGAYSKPSVY